VRVLCDQQNIAGWLMRKLWKE